MKEPIEYVPYEQTLEDRKPKLKERLFRFIAGARYRREPNMCRRFGAFGTNDSSDVEDALFELVREGKIAWFGDNDKPLWYRVVVP